MKLYIGLVTFLKGEDILSILTEEEVGAVGWMGGRANNAFHFRQLIEYELGNIGLDVEEIEDVITIEKLDQVRLYDPHLADNMNTWEKGKSTVWGAIYGFTQVDEVS